MALKYIQKFRNDDEYCIKNTCSSFILKARNDTLSFESVRSTIQVDKDAWFYEVTLLTSGIMQIGFATKLAHYFNHVIISAIKIDIILSHLITIK